MKKRANNCAQRAVVGDQDSRTQALLLKDQGTYAVALAEKCPFFSFLLR
jgi:hypothetical protein